MAANTLPAAISILSFLLPATYPLSRLAGEGWGEGGSMDHTNLIFPKQKSHPILAFPRQTGEGTKLLINQRGRLKIRIYGFQTTSFNGFK